MFLTENTFKLHFPFLLRRPVRKFSLVRNIATIRKALRDFRCSLTPIIVLYGNQKIVEASQIPPASGRFCTK